MIRFAGPAHSPQAGRLAMALALAGTAVVIGVPPATLDLAAIALLLLGMPHGALDIFLMRRCVASPAGYRLAGLAYLAVVGAVTLLGHMAPMVATHLLLLAALLHFADRDRIATGGGDRSTWIEGAIRGALPLGLPALLAPTATATALAAAGAGEAAGALVGALGLLPIAAVLPLGARLLASGLGAPPLVLPAALPGEAALLVLAFACLPPPPAFACYFVGLHADRHWRRERPAALTRGAAIALAAASLGALALFAAVFGAAAGETAIERALAALVPTLLGLTLCHMAVVRIARVDASPVPGVAAGA